MTGIAKSSIGLMSVKCIVLKRCEATKDAYGAPAEWEEITSEYYVHIWERRMHSETSHEGRRKYVAGVVVHGHNWDKIKPGMRIMMVDSLYDVVGTSPDGMYMSIDLREVI